MNRNKGSPHSQSKTQDSQRCGVNAYANKVENEKRGRIPFSDNGVMDKLG